MGIQQQVGSAIVAIFSQIVLRSAKISCMFCNSSIISLLCAALVEESCLLSSDKNNIETLHDVTH